MIDDDIPVLTQILRTGDRSPAIEPITLDDDAVASEPAVMFDALIIGSEVPAPDIEGRRAPLDETDAGRGRASDAIGDETDDRHAGEHAGDSFRLPQDHDHSTAAARSERLNEPEIGTAVGPTPVTAAGQIAIREPGGGQRSEEHGQPSERRINPFLSGEPRERRQGSDDFSLQRFASITSSVRDSVLVALQTRIDTELDARIAQAMHREVETAIAHLQDKLRDGLTAALRDVVARAVDDEMTRFVAAERDAAARLDPRKPPVRYDA